MNTTQVSQKINISDVVSTYSKKLKGFIQKRVNRIEDTEDILQDVFVRLAEADYLMKPIDEIAAWLFTVARNRITDSYRKKRPELVSDYFADQDEETMIDEWGEWLFDDTETPESEYVKSIIYEEISQALDDLPAEQRDVFVMTEFQGMSFKEISQLTGVPVNTLISRKHYAIRYMREELKILYEEFIHF